MGQKTGRIRLQGQTKDVYQAEIKVKEILHNIKTEMKEQQDRILLAQFVSLYYVEVDCYIFMLIATACLIHFMQLIQYISPDVFAE